MSQFVVFDIETYRPDWRDSQRLPRRQDLDPAKNSIITVGFFDGKYTSMSPVIEDLRDERVPLEFFIDKLEECKNLTLLGYNILRFDIPYLAYKARLIGKNVDFTKTKLLDLYWILPYWLHNLPNGIEFFKKHESLGNLWSLDKVREYFLNEEPNPFPSSDVPKLYQDHRFPDIQKHLELDLLHTFSFLQTSFIQETLNQIEKQHIDKEKCKDLCPFKNFLPIAPDRAICYCPIKQDTTLKEGRLSALDLIDYPLPKKGIFWKPYCL